MKDIRLAVLNAMLEDDTNDSDRIIRQYEGSNEMEKLAIDGLLISLCGYSYSTLMKQASTLDD